MRKIWKQAVSVGVAAALCTGLAQAVPTAVSAEGFSFTSECEDLTLSSDAAVTTNVYGTEYPGYTGDGFVWVSNAGTMSFTVDVPETGMYRLQSRCWMYLGEVGEIREGQVSVERSDDSTWSKTVKIANNGEWTDFSWGDIKLTEGENTITFGGGWGFCLYDSMSLTQTPPPDYAKATDTLTDSNATSEAQSLMKYLKSVYGSHIISGQQEIYGGGNDGDMELEFDYIKENTGKLPAIRGFDFMNYNPLYGWDDGTTERAIEWAKEQNGIVTASWHINVPIDFDNYELGDTVDWKQCTYANYQSSNSTFNTANAIVEGTKEYEYFQAAMKMLAEQLLRLQDEGVPIILRPLHEAQGNEGNYGDGTSWFWWGDRGAEVYKELWKLLYTTLTEEYGLHNIIWEYNSYNYANSDTWYPGDEYVDIVAYDKYNCEYNRDDGLSFGTPNLSAISSVFNYLVELTDGEKMVAMAENDSIPSVENLTIENAGWLYFCPWYGDHLMSSVYNDPEQLSEMYNSDYCITLDELPADLYSNTNVTTGTTVTTKSTQTSTEETNETETTVSSVPETTTSDSESVTTTKSGINYDINLTISQLPKLSYNIGEELDLTELLVSLGESYDNVFNPLTSPDLCTVDASEFDSSHAGTYTIFVKYIHGSVAEETIICDEASFEVTVNDNTETTTESAVTTESTETTATGDQPPLDILYGDVNTDGKVDLTDAILLNKACAGAVELSGQALINADCDANNDIDTNDAIALLRFLVHLINELPSAE